MLPSNQDVEKELIADYAPKQKKLLPVSELPRPEWFAKAQDIKKEVTEWLNSKLPEAIDTELKRAKMGQTEFKTSIDLPIVISKPYDANESEQNLLTLKISEIMSGLGYEYSFEKARNRRLPSHKYPWTLYVSWKFEV